MDSDEEFEASIDDAYDQMCEDWAAGLDVEHARVDEPVEEALLHRPMVVGEHNYIETAWLHGYPRIRSIVVTCPRIRLRTGGEMPGAVREIPVGWQAMGTPAAFGAEFRKILTSYVGDGWKLVTRKAQS